MSKDKTPNEYEVGYRRPPKQTRFKPGQSGNPRGPKPRLPRAEIESQISKDLRRILRTKVTVNGEETSILEALLMQVVHSALKGNQTSTRYVIRMAEGAYRENEQRKPDLQMIDQIDFDRILRTPHLRELWLPLLQKLAEKSREP